MFGLFVLLGGYTLETPVRTIPVPVVGFNSGSETLPNEQVNEKSTPELAIFKKHPNFRQR